MRDYSYGLILGFILLLIIALIAQEHKHNKEIDCIISTMPESDDD